MTSAIKQIVPCKAPIYAVYKDETFPGGKFKEHIYFIGLTEHGSIVGLSLFDGYFEPCDESANFDGLYRERDVKQIRDYDWDLYD